MQRLALALAILTVPAVAAADDDPCAVEAPAEPSDPATPADPTYCPTIPTGRTFADVLGAVRTDGKVRIYGKVVSKGTAEPLAGVTIIAERGGAFPAEAAISDENGTYTFDVVPATYTITMYYLATTIVSVSDLVVDHDMSIGTRALDDTFTGTTCCCCCFGDLGPDMTSMPRFGMSVGRDRLVVSRDRTHRAWIAPVAGADPRTAVTTVNNGARLQSAPGIPSAFVEDVETHTLRIPIAQPSGSGGATAVALRGGSNELHGDARAVLGLDGRDPSGGGEVFAGGPLKKDAAWFAAGIVATRDRDDVIDASGMVHVNVATASEHQGELAMLAQAHGDDMRDGWANGRWVSKLFEGKLELSALGTAERLTLPVPAARAITPLANVIDRAGGGVGVRWRKKALGYHAMDFTAGGGGGTRGDERHSDAAFAAGDVWQVRPNLELHAGVRSDTRTFGAERTTIISPRVAVTYDVTQEGRSDLFVAYQRVPHVDDGLPGDWLTMDARYHDEVAAGVSYLRHFDWPMFGVAVRSRGDTTGVDAWMRYQRDSTMIHVGASSLERTATVLGQHTVLDRSRNDLLAGVTLRASADRTEGGGALVWKHSGDREAKSADSQLSVEAYGGTAGPGARLLLGVAW